MELINFEICLDFWGGINSFSKIKHIDFQEINHNHIDIFELVDLTNNMDDFSNILEYQNNLNKEKTFLEKIFFSPILKGIENIVGITEMKQNIAKAKIHITHIESKITELQIYYDLANDTYITLKCLKPITDEYVNRMVNIINKSTNWNDYSSSEKIIITNAFGLSQTMKNICDADLIQNNKISKKLEKYLKKANELADNLKKIEEKRNLNA